MYHSQRAELIARHLELTVINARPTRRRGERRLVAGGMAAVPGLDRRAGKDRRVVVRRPVDR